MPNSLKNIPYDKVINAAKNIPLATANQVKDGKSHKSPYGNWETNPKDYKGLNDSKYGSGLVCDYIPKLNLHLTVLDFDQAKNRGDIPIKTLKSYCMKMIAATYTAATPSGGLHIYLLSEEPPTKPPKAFSRLNIDFQANYGNGRGKYVVTNYRWDSKGEFKESYSKLAESPNEIRVVKNANDILNALLKDLEQAGHIKNEARRHIEDIAKILKPYVTEGTRQKYSCCIAGYLRKQGYKQEDVEDIIREVFSKDEEIQARVNNVEVTYTKDKKNIKGWSYLKEYLPSKAQEELSNLTRTNYDDIKSEIIKKLAKHQEPNSKLLFDYISLKLDLYINLETLKYYEKTPEGSIVEIDEKRIISFIIDEFGSESIGRKRCIEILKHIIKPIEKDYDLLEFSNGILNTKSKEFREDKNQFTKTPKLSMPFKWNGDAKPGKIGKIIDEILDNSNYPENKELWFRSVGHAFMSQNRITKMTIVTGPPGTGKSTLTTILQRIFNYSSVPTSVINANERFTLYGLIDKDINIDDDINNGMLKSIGHLNTVVSGNGLEVEVKGENKSIKATNPQIPRLFANGNSLPPVIGDGFGRRLLLIHAENPIDYDERDENLQSDILNGFYDEDLEWLVYTAINCYWENINKPITTKKMEEQMKEAYEFQSYPLKKAVEALFEDDYELEGTIPIKSVNEYLKKWSLWAYRNGKITREHKKPSNSQIKKAMDHAGFGQGHDKITDEYGNSSTIRVYEDIKTTNVLKLILGKL